MYKKYNFKDLVKFDIYLHCNKCFYLSINLVFNRCEFYLNLDSNTLKIIKKHLKRFKFKEVFRRLLSLNFIKLENDDIDFIVIFQLLYFVLFIFTLRKK